VTLPVPKGVADASLDAAILLCLARYPGLRRYEIEDDRAVAAILAHAPTVKRARTWLVAAMKRLSERGAIEKHTGRFGWFAVQRAA
jgi:hypothetical protein